MNQNLAETIETVTYQTMRKNSPELLKMISTFVSDGYMPEEIIEICARKSRQPPHRLAFIGCAADYLIRAAPLLSEKIH